MELYRALDDVAEAFHWIQSERTKCTLIVGPGCSLSAGLAANDDTLASLTPREQSRVLAQRGDDATVNPSHLAIAHLVKSGYVDRILTTNIDPLVARACALVGEFPGIFNLVGFDISELDYLPAKAIFHLQGQRCRPKRATALRKALSPVLQHSVKGRACVLLGFSENDPVLEALASWDAFDFPVYWVRNANDPAHPLCGVKGVFTVTSRDTDSFLVHLNRKLGIFTYEMATRLLNTTNEPAATTAPAEPQAIPVVTVETAPSPRAPIQDLREADERSTQATFKTGPEAEALFEAAYALYHAVVNKHPNDIIGYVHWGLALSDHAKLKVGSEADDLLAQACEKFAAAARIEPGNARVEYLWGMALSRRAQISRQQKADLLLTEAISHLSAAEEGAPGTAAYFLGCLSALRQDLDATRHWLLRARDSGTLPARSLLEHNPTLAFARQSPWFAELFAA